MNNKRIEKMIPKAMEILNNREVKIVEDRDSEKVIPSKFDGYIASYGPSIIQAGLLPTITFYSAKERKDRNKINDLILFTLKKSGLVSDSEERLDEMAKSNDSDSAKKTKTRNLILEAVTACKLAMKTFKKVKEDASHD